MGEDVSRADGAQTAMTGAPMVPASVIEDWFDRVLADFQTAMLDETAARRMERIGFTAVIRIREADHLEIWCLFNDTAEVRDSGGGEHADIELVIPAALLEDFWTRHLALEVLEGRVTFTGKVRKLLQMMPVIRAAVLRSHSTEVPS
jgi:hypothetical protein